MEATTRMTPLLFLPLPKKTRSGLISNGFLFRP